MPGVGGRVVRRCCVNFQGRGVLLIRIIVGQGPTIALVVGAGGGCSDIFSLAYHFSFLSPSLWETARYRLKYCLKRPLSPKQPINHPVPGRPTIWMIVGHGPIALAAGAGGGCLDIFTFLYPFFSFSLSLGGWSGGAMVLGKLPVPGRPAYLD